MGIIEVRNCTPAIVDDDMIEYLSLFKWRSDKDGYAIAWTKGSSRDRKMMRMHRIICNAPDGVLVDHINRNRLDNRRENLRFADYILNAQNRDVKPSDSGVIGVNKSGNKWRARIKRGKTEVHLGVFDTIEEAAAARNKYLGEGD